MMESLHLFTKPNFLSNGKGAHSSFENTWEAILCGPVCYNFPRVSSTSIKLDHSIKTKPGMLIEDFEKPGT